MRAKAAAVAVVAVASRAWRAVPWLLPSPGPHCTRMNRTPRQKGRLHQRLVRDENLKSLGLELGRHRVRLGNVPHVINVTQSFSVSAGGGLAAAS